MAQEMEIASKTSQYVVLQYISFAISLVNGLVIAKYLGPAMFGVFSALLLLEKYSNYAHLGVLHAMIKMVPIFRGRGDSKAAERTKKVSFTSAVSMGFLVSLGVLVVSFFVSNVDPSTRIGIRLVAVVIPAHMVLSALQFQLRAIKDFRSYGLSLIFYSSTYLVGVLLLSVLLGGGLLGVLISMLAGYLVTLAYIILASKCSTELLFDLRSTRKLVAIGFPLLSIALTSLLFTSIDQIMILNFLDKVQLGLYSIAIFIANVILMLPSVISSVIMVFTLERYGEHGRQEDIKGYLFQSLLIMSIIVPIISGVMFVISPYVISYLFSQYILSITPVQVLLCGTALMGLVAMVANHLIAINKEWKMLGALFVFTIISAVLNYAAIRMGYGIVGVSIATLISYFTYGVFLTGYSISHYYGWARVAGEIGKLIAPLAYIVIILLLVNMVPLKGRILADSLILLVKLAVLAIFSVPLVVFLERKTKAVTLVRKAVSAWI